MENLQFTRRDKRCCFPDVAWMAQVEACPSLDPSRPSSTVFLTKNCWELEENRFQSVANNAHYIHLTLSPGILTNQSENV
jgi:hypothetical protein